MINYKPIIKTEHKNTPSDDLQNGFKEITGEDLLMNEIDKMQCLIEPIFQKTGLVCLAGSSDTGKSSLLRQLSIAIVTGQTHFLGYQINTLHNSVIYVSTEDDQTATSYLLKRQTLSIDKSNLKGLRFIFEYENLLNELEKRLKRKPADLIIIDCFADIFGNDLKDSNQIRAFLNNYQQLAQKNGCLVLFLHHTGKRTENNEPSKNNLLSGQGFEAKMRLVIELRADQLDSRKRHLCIVKGNYLPGNYKKESHVLVFDETNFIFQNTNERVPFELLVKRDQDDGDRDKYNKILELKALSMTYDQIAEKLGFASKSSISKIIKKGEERGWKC